MIYKKCNLYGLKSKKKLLELLKINDRRIYSKSSFINAKIQPYVKKENEKERLIEAPQGDIKYVQRKILKAIQKIPVPHYVFSGTKCKSSIDNAGEHKHKKYLYKVDISKFFPSISRNKVYCFYLNKLNTSPDVANILTNFSTIDLDLKNQDSKNITAVNAFMKKNSILTRNHLMTGSPLSTLLSFWVNVDMFENLYRFSNKYGIKMSVYVDDIVFSSDNKMPSFFRKKIIEILNYNGYKVSPKKCKYYDRPSIKKVTGVILDKQGNMQVPNKLMKKTLDFWCEVKKGDSTNINRLRGCLGVTTRINGKFLGIKRQIKNKY